jgi:hypothetical protein
VTLTFLIVACVLAIAFFVVLFVRELPLRTVSGARATAMEDAALADIRPAGSAARGWTEPSSGCAVPG